MDVMSPDGDSIFVQLEIILIIRLYAWDTAVLLESWGTYILTSPPQHGLDGWGGNEAQTEIVLLKKSVSWEKQ